MVIALRGLFDIASAATNALDWMVRGRADPVIATIDPDPFFDFSQARPEVEFDDDGTRRLRWPSNEFRVSRFPDGAHDLVLLAGVEPHLRWHTFLDAVLEVVHRTGSEVVVTAGAAADAIPHTRTPPVVGSSTNAELAARLGLSRPRYQGPTGVIGALQERLDRHGVPGISLRVAVPHYLVNAQHPKSSAALLRHLEHVLGVPTGHALLQGEIDRWSELHDAAIETDPQAQAFVRMLEGEFDRRAEAAIPSGDDLAAAFEQFLREQRPDDQPE
jgi:proteasome assembly chaperone (PAC2) family protein